MPGKQARLCNAIWIAHYQFALLTHRSGWALCFLGENEQFECLPPPSPLSHLTHSPPVVFHKWFLNVGVPVFVALWGENFEPNLGFHMSPQDHKHGMQPAAVTKGRLPCSAAELQLFHAILYFCPLGQ